ncbi:MAG: tetratricopeptide repeat protein [Solirubrobacterales bacterium]
MLFDLRGKRRRFIQVVYALLAALFLISFVGFGIGSDVSGGIFDALGVGGSDSSSSNPQYESQIESAEQRLAQDPKDEDALVELARVHFLAGQNALEADEQTGQPVVTDESRLQFDESVSAWERYLKLESKNPDANAAGLVVQGYVLLNDAEGAAETQRIVAEARPSQGAYSNLAFYLYAAGDLEGGDEAAQRAVAEAEGSQRAGVEKQLARIRRAAEKQEEQLKKQAKNAPEGANPLQSPLGGGLGGSSPAPQPAP